MRFVAFLRRFARLMLLLIIVLVSTLALVSWYVVTRFSGSATLPADCAIVFGAAVHSLYDDQGKLIGSRAGPGITRRIETAVDLYQKKYIRTLYLTGGKGGGMLQSEAGVMRDYALKAGVSAGDLVIEDQAKSTWENLVFTRPLLKDCSTVVGISDSYHLARIELLAHKQGWELPTVPSAWSAGFWFESRSVLREALGILFYVVIFPDKGHEIE